MTDIVGKTGLSGAFDTGLHRSRTIAVAHCHLLRNETGQPIDYVVREVNDAYEQITGIHRSSVEGRLVTEVFPGIERVHFDFVGKLVAIGLHGGEMDCELYNPLTHQWLSMYAYASGPDECTAIFVDVSAQKRAEATLRRHQAQLQAIIDNSPVLISMKDRQGKVILANKALLDLVGATQPDQVVGHHVFELFPAEVAAQLWRNDLAALQGNGPVRAEEEVQDKDGDWRTFLTVKFPVSDSATQEPYGVCAISTDITDRKRSEAEQFRLEQALMHSHQHLEARVEERTRELEKARLAADAANKAKSDFLATISHEMRTPLNGVIGLTTLMMAAPIDESKRRHVELVHESGETLLRLLNDFLDFSKIESGHLDLVQAAFDPEQETRRALSMVQIQADRKGLILESHFGPVPPLVMGDGARLQQILLNLLSNAIKFTLRGSVTLSCHVVSRQGDEIVLKFAVVDTGIGIAPHVQQTLFQPFVQADATTSRRFGGTGLGLAICKRLAQAMQGEIGVTSEAGRGSTFWMKLPFRLVDDVSLP